MTEKKYFSLFSCCIITKGYGRSIIIDTQRGIFYFIPNEFADIIEDLKKNEIESVFSHFEEREDIAILKEYLEFLEANELGFYTDYKSLEDFPNLDLEFKVPNNIQNAIFDIKSDLPESFFNRIKELEDLFCEAIQIRMFENLNQDDFNMMCKQLNKYSFRYVEILLNGSNEFSLNYLKKMLCKNPNINRFIIYSSKTNNFIQINKAQSIEIKTQNLIGNHQCGQMGASYFNTNLNHVLESFSYNTCLNKKISFTEKGEIKNCPNSGKTFGSESTPINQVIDKSEFKKMWNIKKDDIEICKDCEFRHICTDCRYVTIDQTNIFSKPKNCKYDPYKNIWV